MADRIIKNAGNDFQLIIGDDNITYQDLKKHRQAVIPYDNIDCIEFNKLRTGTGFTRELEVVIELIDDIGYTSINGWEDYVDEDIFEQAMQESNEFYCDDIASESSAIYGSRLVEECYDNGLIDDDDFETDEDGDPNYEECLVDEYDLKEKLAEYLTENSGYSYASQWYMDNFGEEDFNEFVKRNNAVDIDELAEYVVRSDGAANTLARYDGQENTFEFDETTYYIYKA